MAVIKLNDEAISSFIQMIIVVTFAIRDSQMQVKKMKRKRKTCVFFIRKIIEHEKEDKLIGRNFMLNCFFFFTFSSLVCGFWATRLDSKTSETNKTENTEHNFSHLLFLFICFLVASVELREIDDSFISSVSSV